MQANVKEILLAARATGCFETIRDRSIILQDDLPAFNVLSRLKNPESQNTAGTAYNGAWQYDCMVTIAEDREQADEEDFEAADYAELEAKVHAVLSAILGSGDWELTDGPEFGQTSVISGRETLGAVFTLSKHQVDRYGA